MVDRELNLMIIQIFLNLGTNFEEIYFAGNFWSVDLLQFWTHLQKIDSFLDVLGIHMLKLGTHLQEIHLSQNFMCVDFR